MPADRTYDADFVEYLNAAQSPWHCVAEVSRRLRGAGFVELDERVSWSTAVKPGGKYYFTRNGSTLLAFAVGGAYDTEKSGFIVVGAHTDSPCPKLKPVSKLEKSGSLMLGVVGYGGGIWHSWFDRDLTLVGRALVTTPEGRVEPRLVNVGRPICRIPTLAIHLSLGDERNTFKPNLQNHLPPMLASAIRLQLANPLASAEAPAAKGAQDRHHAVLLDLLAQTLAVEPSCIVDFELQLADTQPAQLIGVLGEFVASGRLDNQGSCYMGTTALIESLDSLDADCSVRMLSMFDHEEVGSQSAQGAESPAFADAMSRVVAALGGDIYAAKARSLQISSDMAHGVHPNYAERHDAQHSPKLHGGLVIKHNANQRYATSSVGASFIREFAKRAGDLPTQDFCVKADAACGTTIGPITAAQTGIRTVDVGAPQLSMHSVREMMGTDDVFYGVKIFRSAYENFHDANKAIDIDGPDKFWKHPGNGWM